jgi:hypothetical protein
MREINEEISKKVMQKETNERGKQRKETKMKDYRNVVDTDRVRLDTAELIKIIFYQ